MHRAANDPAFAARREAAFAALQQAVAGVVVPQGFAPRGQGWAREDAGGRATVWLQRDRYGWEVTVVLRWLAGDDSRERTLSRVAYVDLDGQRIADLQACLIAEGLPWFAAQA
jgi:hypothetical protein